MAYLIISVSGNPTFGGYLSMDGDPSVKVEDDVTYKIKGGAHYFELFSRSDAQRKVGKGSNFVNNLFGASGLLGLFANAAADNAMGESWSFQTHVDDDEALIIEIVSRGNEILSAPQYHVRQLDEETIQKFDAMFE